MADTQVSYPLDLTGILSSNLIKDEKYTLNNEVDGEDKYIVPKCGVYYGESLIVYQLVTNDGVVTKKNLRLYYDYFPTAAYNSLSDALNTSMFGAIEIVNSEITGDIYYSYQIIGGVFYVDTATILASIIDGLRRNRTADWSTLVNVPQEFPPEVHNHKTNQMGGFDAMAVAMAARNNILEDAITAGIGAMNDHINDTELHTTTASQLELDKLVGCMTSSDEDVLDETNGKILVSAVNIPGIKRNFLKSFTETIGTAVGDIKYTLNKTPELPYARMVGQSFDTEAYPDLFAILPSGIIPDRRSEEKDGFVWLIKIETGY